VILDGERLLIPGVITKISGEIVHDDGGSHAVGALSELSVSEL
jgi:hypothetical protein